MVSTRSSGRAQDHTDIKDETDRKEPREQASNAKQQKLKQDGSLETESTAEPHKRSQDSERGEQDDEKVVSKKAKREPNGESAHAHEMTFIDRQISE